MSKISLKELSRLGYKEDKIRSLTLSIISKHYKHTSKEVMITLLKSIQEQPEKYEMDDLWRPISNLFTGKKPERIFQCYELNAEPSPIQIFGCKEIESSAKQQMNIALQLPISIKGALMPDAHAGYGLPIGAVLATENAVIPYGVGVDIGCRMALTLFDANEKAFMKHHYALKTSLKEWTHFGMEGGLDIQQDHEILEHTLFQQLPLLKSLHGKARKQLGSSGSGNHFVEWGLMNLYESNTLSLPAGSYIALLSHSGSRGLGANIAMHYSNRAMEVCRLPSYAKHLAWLDLGSELGQEYWLSMELAGDYAKACHDTIHYLLTKELGFEPLVKVENHHNFAWKEIVDDRQLIVHRKGATPAHANELGIIPGSMIHPGYLVRGLGNLTSLYSASHGAGRAMSRSKAKANHTVSGMKKLLSDHGVLLIGGSTEEAPTAYKDIERVMSHQKELICIEGKFQPKIVRMNKD